MFGIGIIGCGKIAQVRHIPEYADHPEAVLLGFYFALAMKNGSMSPTVSTLNPYIRLSEAAALR